MKFSVLSELRVRYFEENDIEPVYTSNRPKAHLVVIDGEQFWIPKSVVKFADVVDEYTGEIIFTGYWVEEWWLRKHPDVAKKLRRAPIDYHRRGGLNLKDTHKVYKGSRW